MVNYANMLADGLRKNGCNVSIVGPAAIVGRVIYGRTGLGKWACYIDKFVFFYIRLKWLGLFSRADIYHICDHSNAMYAFWTPRERTVVTCHDVLGIKSSLGAYSHNRTGLSGRLLQRWILRGMGECSRIFCDSSATLNQLLELKPQYSQRVELCYIGLSFPYKPASLDRWKRTLGAESFQSKLSPFSYIVHVGGNAWYKNREGVLSIYFEYVREGGRLALIMVGQIPTPKMLDMVKNQPDGAHVFFESGLSNDSLNTLYSFASCLLFPSLQEGFGWPPLEAMAAGCPVVISRIAPMTEIGGKAATYIEPNDVQGAARILYGVCQMPQEMRADIVASGLFQAEKFSVGQMCGQIFDSYRALILK